MSGCSRRRSSSRQRRSAASAGARSCPTPSRASARGCGGSTGSHGSSNGRKEHDEHDHGHHPQRARDPGRAGLRGAARARLLRVDGSAADPRMVGRRHGRRGNGRPPGRHVPVPHGVRRRGGRVPRGRGAGAARADVPESPTDAGVRGSRRPDEADADDALRHDRGARYDDAVRRRGGGEDRLRPDRWAAPAAARQNGGTSMNSAAREESASELISKRISELGDWRGETLARVRELIEEADPEIVEEWKWAKASSPGTPVWSHDGIVCTGETYKNAVKLTFAKGASLKDPSRLFNASLDGKVRRAIDIHEGDEINERALKELIG